MTIICILYDIRGLFMKNDAWEFGKNDFIKYDRLYIPDSSKLDTKLKNWNNNKLEFYFPSISEGGEIFTNHLTDFPFIDVPYSFVFFTLWTVQLTANLLLAPFKFIFKTGLQIYNAKQNQNITLEDVKFKDDFEKRFNLDCDMVLKDFIRAAKKDGLKVDKKDFEACISHLQDKDYFIPNSMIVKSDKPKNWINAYFSKIKDVLITPKSEYIEDYGRCEIWNSTGPDYERKYDLSGQENLTEFFEKLKGVDSSIKKDVLHSDEKLKSIDKVFFNSKDYSLQKENEKTK
jgi:hypothetical protein